MTEHLKYDFPAISDGEKGPASAGKTAVEDVFEYREGWKDGARGGQIGTLSLTYSQEEPPERLTAKFDFTNKQKETVTYEGKVPANGSGKGKGRVKFQKDSGTGKFKDRNNEIDVEFHNPKRWG